MVPKILEIVLRIHPSGGNLVGLGRISVVVSVRVEGNDAVICCPPCRTQSLDANRPGSLNAGYDRSAAW